MCAEKPKIHHDAIDAREGERVRLKTYCTDLLVKRAMRCDACLFLF